jgi:hypothetical protein
MYYLLLCGVVGGRDKRMAVDTVSLAVLIVFGGVLVVSYTLLGFKHKGVGYVASPLWLGMGRSTVIMLVVLQVFAAIGFLLSVLTWVLVRSPNGGVLSYSPAVLPLVLALFLAASSSWAFLLLFDNPNKIAVSASLIITALASVVLAAGAAEENEPRWWVVLGTLLLGLVTVLSDGVVWNARWIRSA